MITCFLLFASITAIILAYLSVLCWLQNTPISVLFSPLAYQQLTSQFLLADIHLISFILPDLLVCLLVLQCAGKYTVNADLETSGGQELAVKTGDRVQLVKQGDDGQW